MFPTAAENYARMNPSCCGAFAKCPKKLAAGHPFLIQLKEAQNQAHKEAAE
jgi:hypothetical protein